MKKSFNKLCSKLYANFTSMEKCTKYSKIDCCAALTIGIYFLGTIVPRKYMPIFSAVGLFCCDKFEENPKRESGQHVKVN